MTSPVQSQIYNLFFHFVLQCTHSDIFSLHLYWIKLDIDFKFFNSKNNNTIIQFKENQQMHEC